MGGCNVRFFLPIKVPSSCSLTSGYDLALFINNLGPVFERNQENCMEKKTFQARLMTYTDLIECNVLIDESFTSHFAALFSFFVSKLNARDIVFSALYLNCQAFTLLTFGLLFGFFFRSFYKALRDTSGVRTVFVSAGFPLFFLFWILQSFFPNKKDATKRLL